MLVSMPVRTINRRQVFASVWKQTQTVLAVISNVVAIAFVWRSWPKKPKELTLHVQDQINLSDHVQTSIAPQTIANKSILQTRVRFGIGVVSSQGPDKA
jgi:hypothetical protein